MNLFRKNDKTKNKHELNKIGNGEFESKLIKKENQKIWLTIGIASLTVLIIIVTSCIIDIYDKSYKLHPHFGYCVLGLILLALIIFIFIPLMRVIFSPTFQLDAVNNTKQLTYRNFCTLKNVAKNIINGKNSVPDDEKELLKTSMSDRYQLRTKLNFIYDKYIKKDINKIIWASALKVACSTGISNNSLFDAFTTIITNSRMIMQIVIKCGYRPTYSKLGKLMFKTFRNALVAYTLETSSLAEWLVNACSKFFKDLPAIGKPVAAIMEGAANGFLTARVGVMTRQYLYQEFKVNDKGLSEEEYENMVRSEAIKEAKIIIDESGA